MNMNPYDEIFQEALERAIQSNPDMSNQLAAIQEDHNERRAEVQAGKPYFQIGEQVGLRGDWSLGEIVGIRPACDSFEYLVAWLDSENESIGERSWQLEADLVL